MIGFRLENGVQIQGPAAPPGVDPRQNQALELFKGLLRPSVPHKVQNWFILLSEITLQT